MTNPHRPRPAATRDSPAKRRTAKGVPFGGPAFVLAVLLVAAHAPAQDLRGAGGFIVPGGATAAAAESHAWVVVPASGSTGFGVIHIPPRGGAGPGGVVQDGRVETPARLVSAPERIAAWERTVYLAFPPEPTRPGERQRRVLTITASPSPMGGGWEFDTAGRLNALASIPGDAPLLGFAGSPRGPVALIDDESSGRPTLLVFAGVEWRPVPLPDPAGADAPPDGLPRAMLLALREGPGLLIRGQSHAGLWRARFAATANSAPLSTDAVTWSWEDLPLGGDSGGRGPIPEGSVFELAGRLVFAERDGDSGTLNVWSVSDQDAREIARVPNAPPGFAIAPLDQSDRLIVFGVTPAEGDAVPRPPGASPANPRYDYTIIELSGSTGRVLYSGAPTSSPPLSPAEFRVLVLLLLGVTVVILVFVLRPTGPGGRGAPLVLPPRTMLAEPGRRIAAALIDVAPALLLASRVTGVPLGEAFSPAGALSVGDALALALDALAIAFAHTAAAEALFGRSLGKALVGCEVVRVVIARAGRDGELTAVARRPGVWRAAVRSLAKWTLAPAALAGIGGPERRHLGDTMTGTAVIVRLHPDEPTPDV
ncbi:MAG: RDD family protein [Phycisphaerales bacterium]